MIFQGGLSNGYKSYVAENQIPDETYQEDGTALFRIQGTAPDNMQAIQVEAVCCFPCFICGSMFKSILLFITNSRLSALTFRLHHL